MGGVPKKKWTGSKANQYISRGRACRKLHLSLAAFRKLCILKGIHPHDPKKKHRKEGTRKVYYHNRDIKYLRREPILWQYRAQRTFRSKIIKHKGRYDFDKVKRMQSNMPQVSLDHLIRERYPKFKDALKDFDDCLTMVELFANLPSGKIRQLTSDRRIECQRLCKEWKYYVSQCGLLRKSFVSVKGVYYQVSIRGKYVITWLSPHKLCHKLPQDVDYRVMSTFLDFYQSMMKFIIFRLFKQSHMKYPPFGEIDYDLTNLSLTKLSNSQFAKKRKLNIKVKQIMPKEIANSAATGLLSSINDLLNEFDSGDESDNGNNSNNNDNKDNVTTNSNSGNSNHSSKNVSGLDISKILRKDIGEDESKEDGDMKNDTIQLKLKNANKIWKRSNLFDDFVFYLNRETPQLSLEFVILSMGGRVILSQNCENSNDNENGYLNSNITHEIVDRRIKAEDMIATREYIQPQWVYDCLNAGIVAPTEYYQPCVQCPPHLSPFVDYSKHGHLPSQQYVIEHWKQLAQTYNGFVPSQKITNQNKRKNNSNNAKTTTKTAAAEKIDSNNDSLGLNLSDIIMDGDNTGLAELLVSEDEVDKNIEKNIKKPNKNTKKTPQTQKTSKSKDKFNVKKSLRLLKMEEKKKQQSLDSRRIEIARRMRSNNNNNDNNINNDDSNDNTDKSEYSIDDLKSKSEKQKEANKLALMSKGQINLAKTMLPKKHRKLYEKWQRNKNRKSHYVESLQWKRVKYEDKVTKTNFASKLYNPKLIKSKTKIINKQLQKRNNKNKKQTSG